MAGLSDIIKNIGSSFIGSEDGSPKSAEPQQKQPGDYWGYQDPEKIYQNSYNNNKIYDLGSTSPRAETLANADRAAQMGRNLYAENMMSGDEDYADFIKNAYTGGELDVSNPYFDRFENDLNSIYEEQNVPEEYRFAGLQNMRDARAADISSRETIGQDKQRANGTPENYWQTRSQKDEFDWWLEHTPEGQLFREDFLGFNDVEDAYAYLLATQDYDALSRVFDPETGVQGWLKNRYGYDNFDDLYNDFWIPQAVDFNEAVMSGILPIDTYLASVYYGAENGLFGDLGEMTPEEYQLNAALAYLAADETGLTNSDLADANALFARRGFAPQFGRVVDNGSYLPYADYLNANQNYAGYSKERSDTLSSIADKYNTIYGDEAGVLGFR